MKQCQIKRVKYFKNKLWFKNYECTKLAEKYGTPLFLYDGEEFIDNAKYLYNGLNKYADREVKISFMIKANPSSGLLRLWKESGYQFASAAFLKEVKLALNSGIDANKIMYISGFEDDEKTFIELKKMGVVITINTLNQLKKINNLGIKEIALRLNLFNSKTGINRNINRVEDQKFETSMSETIKIFKSAEKNGIVIKGIMQHLGSQIIEKDQIPQYLLGTEKLLKIVKKFENKGLKFSYICFGGGFSAPYKIDDLPFPINDYAKYIFNKTRLLKIKTPILIFEPGRYLTANIGILLLKIKNIEKKQEITHISLNAPTKMIRRGLFHQRYQNLLGFVPCIRRENNMTVTVSEDLSGKKSNFGLQETTKLETTDMLAFLNMGAYNACSEYLGICPYAKELLIYNKEINPLKKKEYLKNSK